MLLVVVLWKSPGLHRSTMNIWWFKVLTEGEGHGKRAAAACKDSRVWIQCKRHFWKQTNLVSVRSWSATFLSALWCGVSFKAPVQKEMLIQNHWIRKKEVVSELGQGSKGNCILGGCQTSPQSGRRSPQWRERTGSRGQKRFHQNLESETKESGGENEKWMEGEGGGSFTELWWGETRAGEQHGGE